MAERRDYVALATELAQKFAERADGHDVDGTFPHENLADLVNTGYSAMTVPAEHGGGGATLEELCKAQQVLAGGCASTAFAINMHIHGLAMLAAVAGDQCAWAYRKVV